MAPIVNISDEGLKYLEASRPYVPGLSFDVVRDAGKMPVAPVKSEDAWTIDRVNYRGKIIPVVLSRELLPAMNLKQMTAYARSAMKKGEPIPANAQIVYAIAKRAMEQDNREVQKFMKESIFNQYPNTLSVVRYSSEGKLDEIVHNPGLPNEHSSKVDFVAQDEWIKGSKRARDYKLLIGAKNPDEVDEVFGWITGKRAYSWRVNSRPISVDERVVWLYAYSGGFGLVCGWNPQVAGASFGVVLPKKILRRKS